MVVCVCGCVCLWLCVFVVVCGCVCVVTKTSKFSLQSRPCSGHYLSFCQYATHTISFQTPAAVWHISSRKHSFQQETASRQLNVHDRREGCYCCCDVVIVSGKLINTNRPDSALTVRHRSVCLR